MALGNSVHDDRDRRLATTDPNMEVGIYLGIERDSNEYRVGAPFGVVKATTIKRLPVTHRWQTPLLVELVGYIWSPFGKSKHEGQAAPAGHDGDAPTEVEFADVDEEDAGEVEDDGTGIQLPGRTSVPVRHFHLRDTDVIGHGFTEGCRGCRAIQNNLKPVGHNRECHDRIAALLRQCSAGDRRRVERAEARMALAATEEMRRVGQQEEVKKAAGKFGAAPPDARDD